MDSSIGSGNSERAGHGRRRLRRVLAIAALVVASPFVAFAVFSRVQHARLDRVLDAIEARGEPVYLEDISPQPLTPQQQRAAQLYADFGNVVDGVRPGQFSEALKAIEELSLLDPPRAAADPRLTILRAIETRYATALDTLDAAALLDAHPLRADRMRRWVLIGGIVAPSAVRIARMAFEADGDGAARTLVSLLRLRRVVSPATRTFITRHTADSIRLILTFSNPSERWIGELAQEYGRSDYGSDVDQQLIYGRAHTLFYLLPGEFGATQPTRRLNPLGAIVMRMGESLRTGAVAAEVEMYEKAIEIGRQPWPGRLDATAAFLQQHPRALPSADRGSWLSTLRRPWQGNLAANELERAVTNTAEATALARSSTIALALARHRRDRGSLPQRLEQLTPAFLPSLPVDPYSGRAFHYAPAGNAFKVYSVGANRKDDGGTWDLASDLKLSRRGNPADIGVAVGRYSP